MNPIARRDGPRAQVASVALQTARSRRSRRIVVVGVGGAGVNTVARLADVPAIGVEFMVVDTSAQTLLRVGALDPLERSGGGHAEVARSADARAGEVAPAPADRPAGRLVPILLTHGTRGLGSGGDAAKAAKAARDAAEAVAAALQGADIVIVVAGLAGGTGGGVAAMIAAAAREAGAVTLGFGIMPFAFEPIARKAAAAAALDALRGACHTTVALDNGRAVALAGRALPLEAALRVADDAVRQAVEGLGALVGANGWIDVDVARALEVLRMPGDGCVALGSARVGDGEEDDRPVRSALRMALDSPLGGMCDLSKARAAMIQVSAGPELAIADVADAAETVKRRLPAGAELFVGAASRPGLRGAARVSIFGAGIGSLAGVGSQFAADADLGDVMRDRRAPRWSARGRIAAAAAVFAEAKAV